MTATAFLPDTRPYPADPVKNELLLHAAALARGQSGAQARLAAESLRTQIHTMLAQNHYLGLSVALSMAPSPAAYQALMQALDDVLQAKTDDEVQWFALPVVLVAGTNRPAALSASAPAVEAAACLANYPHTRALAHATWLPALFTAADLAGINAGRWFAAKQHAEAAAGFAAALPQHDTLPLAEGQSVSTAFALGYGSRALQTALGKNLQEAALPLMQVWQQHLAAAGVTLFANPLAPATPIHAITEAQHLRTRMALDVFAANALRAIRLQSPRAGVVMAAQEGGRLLFGFNATDSQFELQPQVFVWPLTPGEHIETIQQNFLDLMAECQVETIRLLHDPLHETEELPNYAQALKRNGHNPLFASTP
ncbi:conjugal transfer protein [Neisseria leonii]|uniref:conjugal transfer protein n=1 Tax=Neisseria leonii TaxID=2995413 RepID=UPI00237BAF9D|nr:conjugal transfer protein [Neisseria sp. 3986]MDD9324844.1 conjugal transfer protein [Neisseria sp. 3986]